MGTRSADTAASEPTDQLDRAYAYRRQKPPGAPDDGGSRIADAATGPDCHRPLFTGNATTQAWGLVRSIASGIQVLTPDAAGNPPPIRKAATADRRRAPCARPAQAAASAPAASAPAA